MAVTLTDLFNPDEPRGKALREGAKFAFSVLVLSLLLGLFPPLYPYVYGTLGRYPFKVVFIFGMVASVFAQTAVSAFLVKNKLLEACNLKDWDSKARFADLLMWFFAFIAIMTIWDFRIHTLAALIYILITIYMDYRIWKAAQSAQTSECLLADHASICEKICHSLLWKIDGVSLGGVLLLFLCALLLGAEYSPHSLGGVSNFLSMITEPAADPSLGSIDIPRAVPDLFLSGAIGFHFFMTMWLIVRFMLDWDEEVRMTETRAIGRK